MSASHTASLFGIRAPLDSEIVDSAAFHIVLTL